MRTLLYILPYTSIGGTEKHVLDLIRGFSQEHRLILLAPSGELLDQFTRENISYYPFTRLDWKLGLGLKEFISRLREIIRKESVDLIHIHAAPELILLTRMVVRKIPILFTVHGFHGPRKDWDYWGCARICNRFASRVIAVAQAEEQILIGKGLVPEIIQTIYNGVPDPLLQEIVRPEEIRALPAGQTIIGAVARLETTKGIHHLIDAFASVIKKIPHLHLIIVGSGSKEKDLHTQVKKLQIDSLVTFTGYRTNVHDYLHSYDIFVIPSLHEAHPLVLMEGMGHRKPIIATDVGGIPEVIQDGVNGLLIPPENPTLLAEALERLLQNQPLCEELARHARETFEQTFTVTRMLKETWKVYATLFSHPESF